MKFAFIQAVPTLVKESKIQAKKEKKEETLTVDGG